MFRKNTASQFVCFQGVDATTGGIKSGVTWTVRRCIDGTFAAGGGTVTEDSTNGWYKYAMSQADTNGNNISFNFTGTGAVPQTVNAVTTAADPTDAVHFGLTSLPNTACTTNASLITSGTGTDQLQVAAGLASSNAKQINAVSTSAVTTVKAVIGLAVDGVVTTVTNQLTAAQIATGVWQDTTAGDFTTALSVGKSIMNGVSLGTGLTVAAVSGAVGSVTGAVGSVAAGVTLAASQHVIVDSGTVTTLTNLPAITANWLTAAGIAAGALNGKGDWYTGTPPTAAAIATAVWQDTTAGDFATASSPGKIIVTQLGGAFTNTTGSVFSTASLANAPGGGGNVTVGGYAAGQDPATLVLDVAASGHNTAGTIGQKINSAGAASDPLLNTVPGSYASGTAGAALGRIGTGTISAVSVVGTDGSVSVVRGDDYDAADARALEWTSSGGAWPGDLTGASVTLTVYQTASDGTVLLTAAGSVVTPTGSQKVRAELSRAQVNSVAAGRYVFAVTATLTDTHVVTLVRGTFQVNGPL